jgi:predicted nucleic acid-binding protein
MYAFDQSAPAKQRASKEILLHFHATGRDRISVQVISEWRNTMIKKFSHAFFPI